MNIRLQFIDGYFYPTDSVSRNTLVDELRIERFPEDRFTPLTSTLVARGHALAVEGYDLPIYHYSTPYSPKLGSNGVTQDPCRKCRLNGICGDECGRKLFRLFKH
jgi:hypothetical protein